MQGDPNGAKIEQPHKRSYTRPKLREETVFERDAIMANCKQAGICVGGPPFFSPTSAQGS